MVMLSAHFSSSEFECRCGCGFCEVSPLLLEELEATRAHFGGSRLIVLSGCRCEGHNRRCGGAERSRHLVGDAADHYIVGVPHRELQAYYREVFRGRYGVGCYLGFTHLDVRPGPAARW